MWRILNGCRKEAGPRGLRSKGAQAAPAPAPAPAPSTLSFKEQAQDKHGAKAGSEKFCDQGAGSSWYEAISWSGAIVMGWYVSQMACLSWRKRKWLEENQFRLHVKTCPVWEKVNILKHNFLPAKAYTQPETFGDAIISRKIAEAKLVNPLLKNVSLEIETEPVKKSTPIVDDQPDASGFSDVLNIIENKLGILAIENGELQKGVGMLHSAAQRNYGPAQYNLALCYERGLGLKKNEKAALDLYVAAAGKNHPGALYNLAVFYGQGRGGLNPDTTTAEKFLHLAAENGQRDAIDALKKIATDKLERDQKPAELDYESKISISPTEAFLNLINANGGQYSSAPLISKVY